MFLVQKHSLKSMEHSANNALQKLKQKMERYVRYKPLCFDSVISVSGTETLSKPLCPPLSSLFCRSGKLDKLDKLIEQVLPIPTYTTYTYLPNTYTVLYLLLD